MKFDSGKGRSTVKTRLLKQNNLFKKKTCQVYVKNLESKIKKSIKN